MSLFLTVPARADNVVERENAKAGTTDWQLRTPALNHEIEGYASLTSVNRGGQISFFVNTSDATYTLEIFRMGWYGGAGARRMTDAVHLPGTRQPIPPPDPVTGLIECRWTNPFIFTVPNNPDDPTDWASGFYLVRLTAETSRKQSYIIFVVRDDARHSTYLFQSSVTTYQAYNNWGGKSLYRENSINMQQAVKVSFNRPYALGPQSGAASGVGAGEFLTNLQASDQTFPDAWEYHMVRFSEREGYDVAYCTNVDVHRNPALLLAHRGFLSVGHDEYWSFQMRANVVAARDAGVNLGFFASNVCYWQIRLEPSPATGDPNRTVVGYKQRSDEDPMAGTPFETNRWRQLGRPEDDFIGVMYEFNPVDSDIVIEDSSRWPFAGTGLRNGDRLRGLLGYEADRMYGHAPMGTVRVAHSLYDPEQGRYSDMTYYVASSGATVFATGSMQWSWGLDDFNVPGVRPSRLNAGAQQITRNVLARFATNPAPSITSIIPASVPAGGSAFTLTVNGTNFVPSSVVEWNGSPRETTFLSNSQLNAAIFETDTVNGGTIQVRAVNPAPGGGTSEPSSVIVTDFDISPASSSSVTITAGQSATFTLTVSPRGGSFSNAVGFTCSGLPAGSTCSFSPPSITPGMNPMSTIMTISTTARAGITPPLISPPITRPAPFSPLLWLLPGLAIAAHLARRVSSRNWMGTCLLMFLLLGVAAYQAACGGGTTASPPSSRPTATTSTVTVTARSGSVSHTTTVVLTVN